MNVPGTDIPVVYVGWVIGTVTTILTCFVTAFSVFMHLRNYTCPNLQRYIIRILYMAPIYSVCSSLSLSFWQYAKFFDLLRDCYESYLLYSFFCLLLGYINEYADTHPGEHEKDREKKIEEEGEEVSSDYDEEEEGGGGLGRDGEDAEAEKPLLYTEIDGHRVYYGEERVVYILKTKHRMSIGDGCYPIPTPCCCVKFGVGRTFLRWIKRSILQFVFLKPVLAITTVILFHYGYFADGDISLTNGYIYITVIENISVSISVYALVMFYHAVAKELAPFHPIAKYLCVKAIILFAMWQAILVAVGNYYQVFDGYGDLEPERVSTSIQDLLVSVEMLLIATAMMWIFGWQPYLTDDKKPVKEVLINLVSTVNQKDVLKETVRSFSFSNQKEKALEAAAQELAKKTATRSSSGGLSPPSLSSTNGTGGGHNSNSTTSRYGTM